MFYFGIDAVVFLWHIVWNKGCVLGIIEGLPQDAQIVICGDDYCYIHVESDGFVVNLDNNSLEDCYDDINSEA